MTAPKQRYLTEKIQFRESHTKVDTEKLLTKSLSPQENESSYICTIFVVYIRGDFHNKDT